MCERDYGRRKEALADPVSRQDLGTPGLGVLVVCLRYVAARKAWPEYHPHAESRMVWL